MDAIVHVVTQITDDKAICGKSLDRFEDDFIAIKVKNKVHKINWNNPRVCPDCKLAYENNKENSTNE